MSDDQRSPRSSLAVWLTAAMLFPVTYVLSAGPVVVHVINDTRFSYQTRLVFMYLYTPLGWLYHNSETAKVVFEWYYSFWK